MNYAHFLTYLPDTFNGSNYTQPCYSRFKEHLIAERFTVYPSEFECPGSDHPYVDIAARMGGMFWAFEYKSANDSISRGVEQLKCYSQWFDYVVLVTERELDHRKSQNYWGLKDIGAGLWSYDPGSEKRTERTNPAKQNPIRSNRKLVASRFRNLRRSRELIEFEVFIGNQRRLPEFSSV